jgi:succinoglycan biosynthesis protein ExoM
VAQTSNALVAARLLAGPAPFDPAFGVSGGSDSHFFIRWSRQGARLVWCEEAVVQEWLPASRVRAGWILRRAFRVGNCALWAERAMEPGMGQPGRRALKAGARLALGVAQLAPSVVQGRAGVVRALWNVSYGTGAVAALLGYRYTEYRRIHGE